MKRISFALVLLLVAFLFISPAFAQEKSQKPVKFILGIKGFGGNWDFDNNHIWARRITGSYRMSTDLIPLGPFVEMSFAKDHIGLSAHYLMGRFRGDYHLKNNRYAENWYSTTESGTMKADRQDIQVLLRLTPYFRYVSLLLGYQWLKYDHFERNGHGTWTEHSGEFDIPVGVYKYDVVREERNRVYGFIYGLGLRSPAYSGFYAWANGMWMPDMNIKYSSNWRMRYQAPDVPNNDGSLNLLSKVKGIKTELGIAYGCTKVPLEFKLGWWLYTAKADEDRAKEAPVFDEKLSGAEFSVGYMF